MDKKAQSPEEELGSSLQDWNVHCPEKELERRGSMGRRQQENQSSKMRDTTGESTSDRLKYFEAQDVKFKYL